MTLRQPTFGHGGTARTDEEVTIMVSKALASLDAWLELAESVLEEQWGEDERGQEHAHGSPLLRLVEDGFDE
jgi:hypothetical protein